MSVNIFFACPVNASSADYFDLAPEQLLQAQVLSVSKRAETVNDSPAAVFVITAEDISRSGVTTIPDALRMVPGVDVAQSDSNSWAVSIRGFNSTLANKLLVLIDGRTIYNPVFGGVLWEAQDLMLEDIERIEVVRGPGGTLWGANAVNGVINIITKSSHDTQGNLISALTGNEEWGTLSTRHGGYFGEDGSYRVYAKTFDRDNSRKPGGGDTYDDWSGARSGFRMDKGDYFTLQGDAYRNQTEQLRPFFQLVPPYNYPRTQTIRYEGVNLLGRWIDKHDDGSQLSVQSYIDWARRDEPYNFVDNRVISDVEAQYNLAPIGRHEIITGLGYRFSADNEKGNRNVVFTPKKRRDSLYSAFVQDKITLMPDTWFLTIGSKIEHNPYSGVETQPSARLQWHPDAKQTVWSAVSKAVRTPTPIESDLTSTINTAAGARAAFVPNDDFKSERLIAYELGYRNQITPDFSVDIAGFRNVYDNLETVNSAGFSIVNNGVDPIHLFLPFQFTNNMKGYSHGVEMAASWTVTPDLKLSADYTYTRLSLEASDPTQEGGEDIYPINQAGVRASWDIDENWTLDVSAKYTDDLPGYKIDAYTRVDFNLGWKLGPGVRFNLVGQNLLDGAHREFVNAGDINAAEIERSVFGKLTWEF